MTAVTKMRNDNFFPVTILAGENTPFDKDWNNYSELGWTFVGHYLAADGIAESSSLAKPIQAYVFHGKYSFSRTIRKKKVVVERPIIHALHFLLTAHRSRFVKDVEVHFKKLFEVLDKNPTWEKFLDDRGAGQPPRLYNIAVEEGFRSYAFAPDAKLTMGIGPKRVVTQSVYAAIDAWRKMECYITGARHRRGRSGYRKWEDFAWTDYTERDALATTFTARHLPLSDGEDHFGGELKNRWGTAPTSPPPTKRRKVGGKVKVEKGASTTPMKYDPVKNRLVSYIDLC